LLIPSLSSPSPPPHTQTTAPTDSSGGVPTPAPTPEPTPAPTPEESDEPLRKLKNSPLMRKFRRQAQDEDEEGGEEEVQNIAEEIADFEIALEESQAGGGVFPASTFVILDGQNDFAAGKPNAFVQAVKDSPIGVVGTNDPQAVYAAINGPVACNPCGFKGNKNKQIVGENAGECAVSDEDAMDANCTLEGVRIQGVDGAAAPLPKWVTQTGNLFDASSASMPLIDTQITTATLKIGCSSGAAESVPETCVLPSDLQSVIAESLGDDCARINVEKKNSLKHPELGKFAVSNAPEFFAGSELTEVYDLSFTTHDKACAALTTAWVKEFQPTTLQEELRAVMPADLIVNESQADYVTTHVVKGMGLATATEDVMSSVVSTLSGNVVPSVLVSSVDGGRLALPSFEQGGAGKVILSGFSTLAPVSLAMTEKCGMPSASDKPIGQFVPTRRGASNVPFEVPADLAPDTYSIKATQYGISFCTQSFDVTAASGEGSRKK